MLVSKIYHTVSTLTVYLNDINPSIVAPCDYLLRRCWYHGVIFSWYSSLQALCSGSLWYNRSFTNTRMYIEHRLFGDHCQDNQITTRTATWFARYIYQWCTQMRLILLRIALAVRRAIILTPLLRRIIVQLHCVTCRIVHVQLTVLYFREFKQERQLQYYWDQWTLHCLPSAKFDLTRRLL